MNPYFVMLNCPNGKEITPLKDIVGSVILFETELEAREAGFLTTERDMYTATKPIHTKKLKNLG